MRYFLIEGGELAAKAADFRKRVTEAREAHAKWAEGYGTSRLAYGFDGRPRILALKDKPGPGWKKTKWGFEPSYASNNKEGKAVREEISALPVCPFHDEENGEVSGWIGWNSKTRTHLCWAGDSNIIAVTNKNHWGEEVAALEALVNMPVPAGTREISEAEKDLIFQKSDAKAA